jgi:RNA polymerase sigma factor (sigma-70 family)
MADHEAWVRDALRRYEAALLRFAGSIAGRRLAPDVVQDTFVQLCLADRKAVEGHLAAWLFTVCRNRALELCRSERRQLGLEEAGVETNPDSGPGSKFEKKESMNRVSIAMAALPERQREALLLKIDGGLSYREIAEVMNTSVSNVGFILHDALNRIRRELGEEETSAAGELRRSS